MWRIWAAVLTTAACGFSPAAATSAVHDSAGSEDAGATDAQLLDAAPNHTCFGTLAIDQVCFANADLPSTKLDVNAEITIDTDDVSSTSKCGPATLSSGDPACVIAATSFTLSSNAKIHVVGSKPVVFVATTTTIDKGISLNAGAILDASSVGAQVGAGATTTACALGTTGQDPVDKGGGYGGSFSALGGSGGKGDVGTSVGGRPPPVVVTRLRGGCPGGIGEGNEQPRAIGGGVIALIANTMVNDGTIVVGGAGGAATATTLRGGNGGAAGGMIVLDAKLMLRGNGRVEARGGGGGQGVGGNANQGFGGGAGYDPTNVVFEGHGGSNIGTTGGFGGDGAPRAGEMNVGGTGLIGTSTAAGGGGGGASGVIFTSIAPSADLTFKPSPN